MQPAHGFLEQMQFAGAFAWLALVMAAASTTVGGVALVLSLMRTSGARIVAGLALAGVAVTVAIGFGGRALGRMRTDEALMAVDAPMQAEIRAQGYLESSYNVQLALEFAALPALLGVCAFAIGQARSKSQPT